MVSKGGLIPPKSEWLSDRIIQARQSFLSIEVTRTRIRAL